jgi:hypothetical protein
VIPGTRWQIVIAFLIFVDLVVQIQPLLVTARFDRHRVPYPPAIGRDGKIVRIDMMRGFDRDAWISGYLNLYDRRFDAWTAAPAASQRYASLYQSALAHRDVAALDALSGGYILAPGTVALFEPVAALHGAVMHRNPGAFPLAYIRGDITHRVNAVASLAFTPSAVFIEVDAPSDGDVVVTQQAAPGWSVTVDGKAANPHEVSLFRAVHVTRGRHAIKWIYRPLSLIIGAVLTVAALVRLLLPRKFVKRTERETVLRVPKRIA